MGKSKDLATGASYQDQTESDTRYVNVSGDTMTGDLEIDSGGVLKLISTSNGGNNIAFTQGYNSYLTASNNFYASVGGNTDLFNIVNGKVGIQETSPTEGLVVKGDNSSDNIALKYSGTSGGHQSGLLWKDFRNQTNAAIYNNLRDDGVGTAAAHMEFYTSGTGTLTKRMEIDRYGRITMPYQPAFNAYRSTDPGTSSNYTKMNWSATRFNRGNHFDLSTSRFTAPVGGIYWFGITNNQGSGGNPDSWRLYVNGGSRHIMSYDDNANSWNNTSASLTIELASGDYVEAWWRGDPDFGADWCNFYGHLVG